MTKTSSASEGCQRDHSEKLQLSIKRAIASLLGTDEELDWLIPELDCEQNAQMRSAVDEQLKDLKLAFDEIAKDDFAKDTIKKAVSRVVVKSSSEPPHLELKDKTLFVYLGAANGSRRLAFARLVTELNDLF